VERGHLPQGPGDIPLEGVFPDSLEIDCHNLISYQHDYLIPGFSHRLGFVLSRDKVPRVMVAIKENLDYLKSVIRESYGVSQQALLERLAARWKVGVL